MRQLIYFPGFEIPDLNWLKFALLYFDKLRPIVPEELMGKPPISKEYMKKVCDETDLIDYYTPRWHEITAASRTAEEYIKYLLDHSDEGMLSRWREQQGQNVYLYRGKIAGTFPQMCIDEKLAIKHSGGLLMTKELSFAYMSILAKSVAENAGIDMITDDRQAATCVKEADLLSNKYSGREVDVARAEIEFFLPRNLNDISIDEIISLRMQAGFSDIRVAFMEKIKDIVVMQDRGEVVDVHSALQSYYDEILAVFKSVFQTAFPIIATVSGFHTLNSDPTENAMIDFTGDAIDKYHESRTTISQLKKSIDNFSKKKKCRKFIAEISQFNNR